MLSDSKNVVVKYCSDVKTNEMSLNISPTVEQRA